jgi:hypothetical protein
MVDSVLSSFRRNASIQHLLYTAAHRTESDEVTTDHFLPPRRETVAAAMPAKIVDSE